ncbi:MAG: VTT domain-containing protein [Anaerolineae bacterium]|nr:VTT domain-containing protein [Anaerolineae bacterium]
MSPETRKKIFRALILVFVVSITIIILINRERIGELKVVGYPGMFLISIIANATIIIPIPGVLITSAMGAVFNPFWVAVAAGCGAAIGELTGYLAGYSGQGVVERSDWHDRLVSWMRRYGDVTILVLAFIPNPAFDVAGITAGMLKMPWYRYLIWSAIGKMLKMAIFAYGGSTILGLFPQ